YEPGRDIQISYTGIRPGEKLFEELFLGREEMASTRHERIFISTKELDDNYTGINKNINVLVKNALSDRTRVLNLIRTLVPEYQKPVYKESKVASTGEVIYLEERGRKTKILTN
ncbi:MAG: polysaccharide biosynthesis protein, partial [Syntrophomonas sp.]